MREHNYLFSNVDWFSVAENQKNRLAEEVENIDSNRLLNTSVEDLCNYFGEKYRVVVPTLHMEEIVADQRETKIDVSGDPLHSMLSFGRGGPRLVPGTMVEISVPFDGDAEVFNIQPTTYTMNPPCADVKPGALLLKIIGTNLSSVQVKSEIDRTLSEIQQHLATLRKDAQELNSQLSSLARVAIERRRGKLLANQNLVASLGFKIQERPESRTYAAKEVRRKLNPVLPPASTLPYKPEPTLSTSDYDHVLEIIENMANVMELSPSAFKTMDEESLRSHFLVQLNGHFQGQATGETFNYEGKTDILIRSEGKNIFIGECKFWDGARKLMTTLDQLLSYASWRDTKVAVLLFNRRKDFSKVLEAIPETVKSHSCYKRDLGNKSETVFQYIFANRDDKNREMILTVLAFDVPS